jgi:serine/threonine protein kinase
MYMADEDSSIGKIIGNYRITAELGSGSFADVYLAQHIIFADKPAVAIKLLYARLKLKEREHFIQEAQFLHRLQHPHILPVLDAGFQDGTPYIIMEYAAQGSLQDRLDRQPGKALPLAEGIAIITNISEALYYAHQQNIVHRDLKPDNILFNAKGEALLADFGLATILSSARTMQVGSAGTPAYMAPEMFDGRVSVKSDQYTLGCIAYELLTGRKPFDLEGVPIYAAQYQHAKVEPGAPTRYNPQIPQHIEQAILTAMAKDRNNRHADVHVFLTALRAPQKSAQEWLEDGFSLYDLNRNEEAIAAYEQALRLDPNYANAYNGKGNALRALKRYEEALAAYEQALRLNPNDAFAYNGKGNALNHLKRYEEAIAIYEQALRLDPNYANAYHNKGLTLDQLGRKREAQQAYEKAKQLRGDV